MIILTLKERNLIDQAIGRFGDPGTQRLWRAWQATHRNVRYPDGPMRDDTEPMSRDLVAGATEALNQFERMLQARIAQEPDDNEAANMCNDVAEIHSTVEAVQQSVVA